MPRLSNMTNNTYKKISSSYKQKKLPISAPNQYRNGGEAVNRYFKISDAKSFAFYKVPKALFEEKYKSVSTDAKMLYGLLLDRMYLSVKNGWIDKQGRVYQYFTIKSVQERPLSFIPGRLPSFLPSDPKSNIFHT